MAAFEFLEKDGEDTRGILVNCVDPFFVSSRENRDRYKATWDELGGEVTGLQQLGEAAVHSQVLDRATNSEDQAASGELSSAA